MLVTFLPKIHDSLLGSRAPRGYVLVPSAKIQVALWLCLTEDLGKTCEEAGKFTNIPLSVSAFMIASASYRGGRLSILDHSMRQPPLGFPCAVSNQIFPLFGTPLELVPQSFET